MNTCVLTFVCVVYMAWIVAESKGIQECKLSQWQAWGPCVDPGHKSADAHPFSYPLTPTDAPDKGRAMMELGMRLKTADFEEKHSCVIDNTCPEYYSRPTTGPSACKDGIAAGYPCRNIDLLSHISIEDLGYTKEKQQKLRDYNVRGNDIWGWTDPETGREYAIIGLSGGSSFVDVTEPTKPIVLAFLLSRTGPSIWRDMKVVNNAVYIVAEARDHGLQVFDLERLRTMTSFSDVNADAEYSLFGNAHNIVSNEETGYVYVVGATQREYQFSCKGGLHYINVRDHLNPAYAGCFPDDGYVHDAQCVIYHGPDTRYQGKEICFCYNEDSLTLVDVTDKENAILISKRGYSHSMYTHQGWLTEDHTIALLDDELDENRWVGPDASKLGHTITYVWDVRDLTAPVLKSHFLSSQVAIDHNQYILGNLTYQSNYGAGLRILHIEQESYSLKEVAYFDVLPTNRAGAQFEGTWSNYPYFKSGNVIVSSIEYGLFVVRPDQAAISKASKAEEIYMEHTRVRDIQFAPPNLACAGLMQTESCSKDAPQE